MFLKGGGGWIFFVDINITATTILFFYIIRCGHYLGTRSEVHKSGVLRVHAARPIIIIASAGADKINAASLNSEEGGWKRKNEPEARICFGCYWVHAIRMGNCYRTRGCSFWVRDDTLA